ncbi:MAG: hypothetical protein V9G08_03315 [Dermatophilaceae bacterium]
MATTPDHQTSHRFSRLLALVVGALLLTASLAACAASGNPGSTADGSAAGFWLGLWQGFIAPIAFLVSLFNHSVGIYEVHNSGAWYDVGYLIGISAFFSGGPAGARRRSRSSDRRRRPAPDQR